MARIIKVGRLSGDELEFEDIKVSVKIRDIHKIERKNSRYRLASTLVFLVMC